MSDRNPGICIVIDGIASDDSNGSADLGVNSDDEPNSVLESSVPICLCINAMAPRCCTMSSI